LWRIAAYLVNAVLCLGLWGPSDDVIIFDKSFDQVLEGNMWATVLWTSLCRIRGYARLWGRNGFSAEVSNSS